MVLKQFGETATRILVNGIEEYNNSSQTDDTDYDIDVSGSASPPNIDFRWRNTGSRNIVRNDSDQYPQYYTVAEVETDGPYELTGRVRVSPYGDWENDDDFYIEMGGENLVTDQFGGAKTIEFSRTVDGTESLELGVKCTTTDGVTAHWLEYELNENISSSVSVNSVTES